MRVRTLELPLRGPDADRQFALLVDRVDPQALADESFPEQMAVFRDHCGAIALLVSELDIELDNDPVVVEDLAPEVSSILPRVRELRERLYSLRTARPRALRGEVAVGDDG